MYSVQIMEIAQNNATNAQQNDILAVNSYFGW